MSFVQKITMTDAKVKFGSLSLNNQYQVHFAGINGAVINYLRFDKRINNAQDFISREMVFSVMTHHYLRLHMQQQK